MAYQLACKDLGMDCKFINKSESIHKLLARVARHAKEAHGYTDAQLQDSEMVRQLLIAAKRV